MLNLSLDDVTAIPLTEELQNGPAAMESRERFHQHPGTDCEGAQTARRSKPNDGHTVSRRAARNEYARLVDRAQRGDEAAFEALYHQHKRRVYSLCLRMTKDPVQAEDLMQEAFLHLFRKISSFRGEAQFTTWLHRLVVNVVLMRLRKKSLRQVSIEELFASREEFTGHDVSQDYLPREFGQNDLHLVGSVDRVTLAKAIEQLPDGYRTVFLLHDVEGYEHREIAQLKKCSVGNCKSQLHKARVRLRELLRPGQTGSLNAANLCPMGIGSGG